MQNYSRSAYPKLDQQSAAAYFAGLPTLQQGYYEQNPTAALDQYAQKLGAPLSNANYIRSLYTLLRNRWVSEVSDRGMDGRDYKWTEFLSNLNPNQEVFSATPRDRFEQPGRFSGRARTVAF